MTTLDKVNLVVIVMLSLVCLALSSSVKQMRDENHYLNRQADICEESIRSERNYSEILLRVFQKTEDKLKTCEAK